jgi:molybdenum cofactor cytidylyltransferase
LHEAGVADRLVVVGADRAEVEAICVDEGANPVFNKDFQTGEMLSSVQAGLKSLDRTNDAVLLVLGDQPGIEARVIGALVRACSRGRSSLVIPSFQHHRGHPWIVGADWWEEIIAMSTQETPRNFLGRHANEIEYVETDTDSILRDIDTPEDYERSGAEDGPDRVEPQVPRPNLK